MAIKRLVAIVCCLFSLPEQVYAVRRVKGPTRKLQKASVTRPPERGPDPVVTKVPTDKRPTLAPKASVQNDQYWSSQDDYPDDNMKGGENKQKDATPPPGTSPDVAYKSGGSGGKGKGGTKPSSGVVKGESTTNTAQPKGGTKVSGGETTSPKVVNGGSKINKQSPDNATNGGLKDKNAGVGSYVGDSSDPSPKVGGGKGSSGSTKTGDNKESTKTADKTKTDLVDSSIASSESPADPSFQTADGKTLTGVPITRFALLYSIDHSQGMPMTQDYEQVHENTYLWLYTVMFRTFGERMKNLLTDDTSNIYEANQAVTIEYASVALFDPDDGDIPTTEELDSLVLEAFSGENLEFYLQGVQKLPPENPFSTTTAVDLEQAYAGAGRNSFASRVSTRGTAAPLVGAAALCVMIAGGAMAYRLSRSGGDEGGKPFDSFSRGDTVATDDDLTASLGGSIISAKRSWDLHMEVDPQNQTNLAPISEERMDPDLAHFSEYFDSPDSPTRSTTTEELSQYSIEDFVNEAERNLLGVRIRYPGETIQSSNDNDSGADSDMSSAFLSVPALSSPETTPKLTCDPIGPAPRSPNLFDF